MKIIKMCAYEYSNGTRHCTLKKMLFRKYCWRHYHEVKALKKQL